MRRTAEQFGSGLRTHWSWRKGDVLALFSPNCIDTPAVTWGCHWAGGVVSPANPAYTASELTHHLKDSGAKVLVTQPSFLKVALEAAKAVKLPMERIILIGDKSKQAKHKHFTSILDSKVRGSRTPLIPKKDLAFLVYSSGTTGNPKGVMLNHFNLVSDVSMLSTVEGRMLSWETDKILAVLPYYHIYGIAPISE